MWQREISPATLGSPQCSRGSLSPDVTAEDMKGWNGLCLAEVPEAGTCIMVIFLLVCETAK